MNEADALSILRIIRREYDDRLARAINPRIGGDWMNRTGRLELQQRIQAIDVAIVYLSLIHSGQYAYVANEDSTDAKNTATDIVG